MAVGAAKGTFIDLLVQTKLDGRSFPDEVNWRRTAVLSTFGFGWVGFGQYMLLVRMTPLMFKLPKTGVTNVAQATYAAKVVSSDLFILPLLRSLVVVWTH